MVELPQFTTYLPLEDETIPLVEAVYIDSELTEVHPDNVIVDLMEQSDITLVAVVANEVSPSELRRSSCCSCVSNSSSSSITNGGGDGHRNSMPEEEDATSATSRSSFTQAGVPQDEQHLMTAPSFYEGRDADDTQMFGAGAAGAVLGLLMGGPLLCVALGLGSLYCSQQEGAAGDIARAMGDVALLTHTKFQELNEKHQLVDKGKEASGKVFTKLRAVHERHRQPRRRRNCEKKAKVRKLVAWCWKSVLEFERKHKVLQRLSLTAKEKLDALVEQYSPCDNSINADNGSMSSQTPQQ